MSSYSLYYCKELKIDTTFLRNEVRGLTSKYKCDMNLLTNYATIDQLITKIAEWRQNHLKHQDIEKSKLSIYGELLVASLMTKNEYFEDWLSSLAVYGYADNTNRDIKYEWIESYDPNKIGFDVEVKTLSHYRRTAILEHKHGIDKNGDEKFFRYPDCLAIVRNTHKKVYQLHSITRKAILEEIAVIKPTSNGRKYEFELPKLTLL